MSSGKVISVHALLRRRKSWRAGKKKIVFTNGIFDILHRGHVEYLTAAKKMGDILVVAINTDESARKLKGPSRPINELADRAAVLAGLEAVDYVVNFPQSTPLNLIICIQPDVLVKGSEYKKHDIVGAKEVESWGGKVVRIPMRRGISTTDLIHKIARAGRKGKRVKSH
jgi:rfaE bifunctional protein nucleotidyltransferase chain/domain